jgi:hypothetical protein
LEDLLFESEELQPKESIKNLEKHLVRIENVIEGRAETMINPRTNTPTIIPGLVTEEEQLIVDRISWDTSAWHAITKQLAEETTSAKEQIEKMRNKLKQRDKRYNRWKR